MESISPPTTNAIASLPLPKPSPGFAQAGGEKTKTRDVIAAIRTLKRIEQERRLANPEEKQTLSRFGGFGAVALSLFPNPVTGRYKDATWQVLGDELKSLLTPEEYDSAKRTTFNAFYTSPIVITAMHEAIARLGIPGNATVLEPGCGTGNFMGLAPEAMRFIGVELDGISGRIARALNPQADIRIENFHDTKLPEESIDGVIGNVPFADLKLDYRGQKLSLHDFCFAKSIDALKPGGVLALVTSHFTMDKQNGAIREHLAAKADFVGAIRLPSDAFKREGTSVVTDIVFLRKRPPGEPAHHADPDWLSVAPLTIEGLDIPINRYFHHHPEMVLGDWSRKDTLYGEGYSVLSNGDLARQLNETIRRLPEYAPLQVSTVPHQTEVIFSPPPPERHISEGSFFVGDDRTICQSLAGQSVPVVYGGTTLRADSALTGKRLAALIRLRDLARHVLQSQNEGWPESNRNDARRELNWAYDRFVGAYGPINKTTFGETKDGSVIRRMPNIVKFKEDPDAMLVMSLEDYDEVSRVVQFHPHNMLKSIRRPTGGEHYQRLRAALERLTHTAVRTNIRAEGKKKTASFHWLDGWKELTDEKTGEPTGMTLTLPDWLYEGILMKGGVLTIHEDYFLLTGGIERWLYRVARKHAGQQEMGWAFTMRQLHEKSGSASRLSDFAIDVRKVVEADSLPEYAAMIHKNEEGEEVIRFLKRDQLSVDDPRYQMPRYPGRRLTRGITAKAMKFTEIAG